MMHLLVSAVGKQWPVYYERPNPKSLWDWCPLSDVDPFNDTVLSINGDRDVLPSLFIETGVRSEHVFGIDGVTKDIQWVAARDVLGRYLNR